MTQTTRARIWPLVALLGLVYITYDVGSQQYFAATDAAFLHGPLRIQYIPDPNDIVNLSEGTPYTVPVGQVLIITDWVTTDAEVVQNSVLDKPLLHPRIRINGVDVWGGGYSSKRSGPGSLTTTGTSALSGSLQSGVRTNAGDVVTLSTQASPISGWAGAPTTFASGYLAEAE